LRLGAGNLFAFGIDKPGDRIRHVGIRVGDEVGMETAGWGTNSLDPLQGPLREVTLGPLPGGTIPVRCLTASLDDQEPYMPHLSQRRESFELPTVNPRKKTSIAIALFTSPCVITKRLP
jgi:hypothetical protein